MSGLPHPFEEPVIPQRNDHLAPKVETAFRVGTEEVVSPAILWDEFADSARRGAAHG